MVEAGSMVVNSQIALISTAVVTRKKATVYDGQKKKKIIIHLCILLGMTHINID